MRLRERLDYLSVAIAGDGADVEARMWWIAFERLHAGNPRFLVRVAEELANRGATVDEMHSVTNKPIPIAFRQFYTTWTT